MMMMMMMMMMIIIIIFFRHIADCAAGHCLAEFYFPRKLLGFSTDRSNFNVT